MSPVRRNTFIVSLSILLILLIMVPAASAHVPILPHGNDSLTTSYSIQNPQKSWAVYSQISAENQSGYYKLQMNSGENLFVQLLRSSDPSESRFSPVLVIEGPGIHNSSEALPGNVEIPNGYGYIVPTRSNSSSGAVYEAFGPDSFYLVSEYSSSVQTAGTYYLAVYSNTTGHYALAVGQNEEYTVAEWITLPLSLVTVYMWVGESLPVVLAPMVSTFAIGMAFSYLYFRRKEVAGYVNWPGLSAGILFIGTGFSTIFQMLVNLSRTGYSPELFITLSLAVLPMAIGTPLILISTRKGGLNPRGGIIMAILGIAGLFSLGGYLIAPALAVGALIYALFRKEME